MSYSISKIQSVLLFLFILLALGKGGRIPETLALYQAGSILLFFLTFNKSELPGIPFKRPLQIFLLATGLSAIYSIFTGRHDGIILYSTLLCHALNFYTILKVRNKNFEEKFIAAYLAICCVFSLEILLQNFLPLPVSVYLPNANLLAGFLVPAILLTFCKIVFDLESSRTPAILIFMILFAAFLHLNSLGSWSALAAGLCLVLILHPKKVLVPLGGCVAFALLILLFSSNEMRHASSKLALLPDNLRFLIWKGAWRAFLRKPFFGWGLGNFETAYQFNRYPITSDIGQYDKMTAFAHNEFLQTAVETGIVGLGCFLWLMISILAAAQRSIKKLSDDARILGAAVSILALFFHALTDFNLHLPITGFILVWFVTQIISDQLPIFSMEKKSFSKRNFWMVPLLSVWFIVSMSAAVSAILSRIGQFKQDQGSRSDAAVYRRLAGVINPFDAENLMKLSELSDGADKEKALKKAESFNAGSDRVHAQLARLYFSEARWPESVQEYQQAIQKNPKNPFYYSELGDIYMIRRQFNIAALIYQKAIEIEPLYCLAHYRLGEIYLIQGQKKKAYDYFENVSKILAESLTPGSEYSQRLLDIKADLVQEQIKKLKKQK